MTLGRPKTFDTDQALQRAMQQFWRAGFEGTSMQDLLKVTGLSKSSLYQTYGSKLQLFLKCLDCYQRQLTDRLHTKLANSTTGMDFIRLILLEIVDEAALESDKKGCLLVNTLNEQCRQDKQIAESLRYGLANLSEVFASALERAKMEGDIDEQTDTTILVTFLMTGISGLRTLVKSGVDVESLLPAVEMILHSLR
ncbi:MAG: TetR/AcrR family transcriptional regulator [Gammaproteobacteria bacterium]